VAQRGVSEDRSKAKAEGAEIQWGDETGLHSTTCAAAATFAKGQTPVVHANARREKLSVISTVTNKCQMRWKVFSGALNAKVLIGFLDRPVRLCSVAVYCAISCPDFTVTLIAKHS